MDFRFLAGDQHGLENLQIKEASSEDPCKRKGEKPAIVEGCKETDA